jgi:hypothetical protein
MNRSTLFHGMRIAAAVAAVALAPSPASAQGIKGPTACFKCHKPQARTMWETQAPFHKNSVQQLGAPKAAAYAAAIGLPAPTAITVKGDCVSCHATLVGGSPSVGISCESCHGPAAGYLKPHEEPTFYDQPESQRLGLRDLFNNPKAIAQMCVDCHVTPDPRLKKAGHPAGEGFDAGKGIAKMVHWDSGISVNRKRSGYGAGLYAQITAAAAPLVAKRLASGGAAVAAAAPARKPAAPTQGAAPAGAAAAPAQAPPRAPAAAPAAADPFDWDQPVAALPADYPGDTAAPQAAAPAAAAPTAAQPEPAAAAVPPPTLQQVPSTAPELPLVPAAPAVAAPAAAPAAVPGMPAPAAPARAASAPGLAAVLLRANGAKSLAIPAPASPREYQGADGELLRIEDEILYLALEALRKPEP